ncbi:TetR/AcrR family transcriptional regulator [Actinomycetospora termitidis]|uniref:TetR/AcrR family transcriptional regulator n=1 Tax=Actinomycetospora termitidis TaxID=3053470 RepID=A0ABT7MKY3_9PSEU|nr:TetR/AcrR family transcriptional regulator [Actinomycetospora sp. Odt1-22]MDL5160577.1 TetR/AcrR family transcriptional regulator [Actinomycetospora sp. Odt1-22]
MPQRSHRAAIVENAEALLRRKGLVAASVADITKAAGVPKGSFYNHFESKEALLAEIVQRFCAATDLSNLEGDGPAVERLRAHFTACSARLESGMEFGCLLGSAAAEAPTTAGGRVQQAVRDGLEVWSKAIAATVAEGQDAGEITTVQPATEIADFLIETFEGAALLAKATADYTAPLRHVELALATLRQ